MAAVKTASQGRVGAVAIRRILALTATAPNNGAWLVEDDFDRGHVRTTVRAVAVRILGALLAPTPRVLASVALIYERPLNDASGRLRTRVGHHLVLQPPGGLSNNEPRPNGTLPD